MQHTNTVDPRINRTRFRLPQNQHWPAVQRKEAIVLHFTAGSTVNGAFQQWITTPSRVATAFVIDLDGAVYELFPPEHWAHHLGIRDTGWRQDKRTIGIELVNVGPLRPSPDNPLQLNWWPPASKFLTRYCLRSETDRYVARSYRGETAFATFPEAQIDATRDLVAHLCERFEIPRTIPPLQRRDQCDRAFYAGFRGIAAHQNFRADKSDIGPAFDWERLL